MNLLRRIISKLPERYLFWLRSLLYHWQIKRGTFISNEFEFNMLGNYVSEGDWVIDIGASVGHYACKLSSLVGPNGRVFAFEPLPETFAQLTANSRHFPWRNLTLINFAVSDSWRIAQMTVPEGTTGLDGHYFACLTDDNDISNASVCLCSIDSFRFPNPVRLVKIDVEGHEIEVLAGIKNLLERDHPVLIVEANSKEIIEFLSELGYENDSVQDSHNFIFIKKSP